MPATPPTTAPRAMLGLLALALGPSCQDQAPTADSGAAAVAADCTAGETHTWVVYTLGYTRREGTVVWGFDLDGHVSEAGDDEGCGHADLVDPSGGEGIDNAFSGLVPALEATEASAVEDLIQNSVNTGELLILFEVSGVDSLEDDDCVTVSIARGEGTPLMGTDGVMLDSQSFSRSDLPPNDTVQGAIVDGILVARGAFIELPIQVLDVELDFDMEDAGVRIDLRDPTAATGFFSGAVPTANILKIVEEDDLADLRPLVEGLVNGAADLYPDETGTCAYLSVAFAVQAQPGFFYSTP